MIDIELTVKPVEIDDYKALDRNCFPILFLGFIIKNEYDNKRIILNKTFNPVKILHKQKAFKGIILTANSNVASLINTIRKQEKIHITLPLYENILTQYGFTCRETYGSFSENIYPIDFDNLKKVSDDTFNTDKKIFQHLLCLDEKVFDFQKFAALKLFILT